MSSDDPNALYSDLDTTLAPMPPGHRQQDQIDMTPSLPRVGKGLGASSSSRKRSRFDDDEEEEDGHVDSVDQPFEDGLLEDFDEAYGGDEDPNNAKESHQRPPPPPPPPPLAPRQQHYNAPPAQHFQQQWRPNTMAMHRNNNNASDGYAGRQRQRPFRGQGGQSGQRAASIGNGGTSPWPPPRPHINQVGNGNGNNQYSVSLTGIPKNITKADLHSYFGSIPSVKVLAIAMKNGGAAANVLFPTAQQALQVANNPEPICGNRFIRTEIGNGDSGQRRQDFRYFVSFRFVSFHCGASLCP